MIVIVIIDIFLTGVIVYREFGKYCIHKLWFSLCPFFLFLYRLWGGHGIFDVAASIDWSLAFVEFPAPLGGTSSFFGLLFGYVCCLCIRSSNTSEFLQKTFLVLGLNLQLIVLFRFLCVNFCFVVL